ncbi:hypothetical protein UA45_13255 [Morganella morganii]|uniref:Uncharacterized protein n=1 Tax=Morganella morganii TaxID=582 RepID=A0A0D8L871_MORMO|nr:hypothetical protein UA45_13255 [Morganella morganii]
MSAGDQKNGDEYRLNLREKCGDIRFYYLGWSKKEDYSAKNVPLRQVAGDLGGKKRSFLR